MEKTPKSKFFGFRSKKIRGNRVRNWVDSGSETSLINVNEVRDLENLPVITKEVLKTPEVIPESRLKDDKVYRDCGSPQFRVGWNDGAGKGNPEMDSPISIVPVQRKIRRCPDRLVNRVFHPNPAASNEKKTDSEDISQCVSWAKNLLESTRLDREDDSNSNLVSVGTTSTVEDSLDDSTNELMILCSQAVEESLSHVNFKAMRKHQITPDHGTNGKRFKKNETPRSSNRSLMLDYERKPKDDSALLLSSESNHRIRGFDNENQPGRQSDGCNNVKNTTMLNCSINNMMLNRSVNNNNNKTNNFNYQTCDLVGPSSLKSYNCMNTKNNVIPKIPINSEDRGDPVNSVLDDEDDFCALDFDFLDSLQTTINESTSNLDVSAYVPKPPVRYTREQIEKRRIEAKKRLLFNKKHKSM